MNYNQLFINATGAKKKVGKVMPKIRNLCYIFEPYTYQIHDQNIEG
ncbi:hypothetical protein [Vibrio aerogenes]|nr:hypothetical protein [Vibrio aerogenes]